MFKIIIFILSISFFAVSQNKEKSFKWGETSNSAPQHQNATTEQRGSSMPQRREREEPSNRQPEGRRIAASPSTAHRENARRQYQRLEAGGTLVNIEHPVHLPLARGIYIISEPGVDFSEIPIIDFGNRPLTMSLVRMLADLVPRLREVLSSHQRYIGQVGGGRNEDRRMIDRVTEHRRAMSRHPDLTLYRAITEMNTRTGDRAGFHAIFYNVLNDELDLLERIMIILLEGRGELGLNSNNGANSAIAEEQRAPAVQPHRAVHAPSGVSRGAPPAASGH